MATLLSDMSLASTWTQCLAEFLPLSICLPMPAIQLDLSHFLDEVMLAIKQSRLAVPQLRDILLPVLTDIRAQDSNPQIVENCLGVITILRFAGYPCWLINFLDFHPQSLCTIA
jgi:serine/threonine-protein kinase ATR